MTIKWTLKGNKGSIKSKNYHTCEATLEDGTTVIFDFKDLPEWLEKLEIWEDESGMSLTYWD